MTPLPLFIAFTLGALAGFFLAAGMLNRTLAEQLKRRNEVDYQRGFVEGQLAVHSRRAVVRELFPERKAK